MIAIQKPSLLNLNIIDTTQKFKATAGKVGKSLYHSIANSTAEERKEFLYKAGTNIAAGALTKAFVGAALAGAAPTVVVAGASAVAVGAVSTKITHWRDCKKAIANNEEPPKFNWENYGLKGMFNTAMAGLGAFFSEQILGLFASPASAETLPELELGAEETATINPHQETLPDTVEIEQIVIHPSEPEATLVQETDFPQVVLQPEAFAFAPEPNIDLQENVLPEVSYSDVPITHLSPVSSPELVGFETDIAIEVQESPAMPLVSQTITPIEVPEVVIQPIEINDRIEAAFQVVEPEPLLYTPNDVQPFQEALAIEPLEISEVSQPLEPIQTDEIAEVLHSIEPSAVEELQILDLGPRAEDALEAHIDGYAQGTADLGYFYFHGQQGVPQDYERAVEFYREAAEQDNTYALRDLSYVESEAEKALGYAVPEVVEEIKVTAPIETLPEVEEVIVPDEVVVLSPIEELQALDLGARADNALEAHIDGNAQGTADLGYFYFHGQQGLPQDYEKAVHFYREAAAEGNRFAIRDLAYIENRAEQALGYAVPEVETIEEVQAEAGVTEEAVIGIADLEALDLGARAESALEAHVEGNAQGTADLGYFYFHGQQGLPQDLERAVEFYREAALEGNGYAIRDLAFVESEALKAGIDLSEFELPQHLYQHSAPAIHSGGSGDVVRSGLRASCVGDLAAVNGSSPQLQFDCDVRGNNTFIYPGEHVSVSLPNGASHIFNLDATAGRQPVDVFLQNSVLPVATSSYEIN